MVGLFVRLPSYALDGAARLEYLALSHPRTAAAVGLAVLGMATVALRGRMMGWRR